MTHVLHLSLTLSSDMDESEAEQWLAELLEEARHHLVDGETIEQRHPIVEVVA